MKNIFKLLQENSNNFFIKLIILLSFIFVFTGADLIVKQIVYVKLAGKPDIEVIPGFWSFHYVTNDDIGFSALRKIDKYFSFPERIKSKTFEEKILKKLNNDYYKTVIFDYYKKDATGKYYLLDKSKVNLTEKILDKEKLFEREIAIDINREILKNIFSSVDFRTQKWIIIVLIQLIATTFVAVFYFRSKLLIHLLPLGLIIAGALGNVIDRIIRGYVVDYVMWSFRFINLRIFNPWPIFNLADVFTVIGTLALFITVFFFSKEDEDKHEKLE
jgi:lipoprotein signal peptidase